MDRLYPEAHAQALRLADSVLTEPMPEPPSAAVRAEEPTVELVPDRARAPSAPQHRWPAAAAVALLIVVVAVALLQGTSGPVPDQLSTELLDAGSVAPDARADDASPSERNVTPDAFPAGSASTDAFAAPTLQRTQPRPVRAEPQDRPDASASPTAQLVTPVPAGRGSLSVIARGAAGFTEVWIDGERIGYAPLQRSLPAGPHEVEVRASTGEVRRSEVVVDPDELERVVARFDTP
jgi:hypothetical protein